MFQNKRSLGFTFIEIMIVITIIATLSAVAFFSYIQFSQKSRDTLRLSNVKEVQGGLEIYAIKTKKYPTPDASVQGNISYNGNSFAYSKVGFVKKDVASALNLKSIPLDPVYQKEIQYATLDNGKRYQLSTVLESMFSSNNTLTHQTYATTQIAKLEGNYNGRFIKVSSGSTHTVISLPSLFLNNGSGSLNITVNQPVQNILVSGAPGSIDILNNTSGNTFSYTPKVIYSSSKCGVETDQEIVDFLLNLRDAYNQDPFTGLDEFRDIFNDYESIGANGKSAQDLKMAMAEIDFSTLERIGSKINDALGCEIKSFKTTDIFPETCQNNGITESGDFEGYPHGYSLTGSCLFSVTGNGTKEVRNNIGKGNSKGLYLKAINDGQGIRVKYTTFSYIPAKLSFDFQTFFEIESYGGLSIYINNILYDSWRTGNNGTPMKTYTTEVMPPGLYTFEFRIGGATYNAQDWVILDNIIFGCKKMGELSGESNCGWTLGFEDGPNAPWDMYTFSGTIKTPWHRTKTGSGITEGNYALKLPELPGGGNASISQTTTFTQTGFFSLDYTTQLGSSSLEFYVDGHMIFRHGEASDDKSTNISSPKVFQSPPLPPGKHTLTVRMQKGWNPGHTANLTLDNFKINYCNSYSQSGCGRTLGFEDGGSSPYDRFSFSGAINTIWYRGNSLSGITEGNSAIISPIMKPSSTTFITYTTNLSYTGIIKFDYVNRMNSGNATRIYLNNQMIDTWSIANMTPNTYETPILRPGKYEIKIELFQNWNTGHSNIIELDNFNEVNCSNPSTPGCGRTLGFEDGNISPYDMFTFTGAINYAWKRSTGTGNVTEGNYSLKPLIPNNSSAILIMNKNLSESQRFSFDIKTNISYYSNTAFYINGIEYKNYIWSDTSNLGFVTYLSPMLPPGDYEFKWVINKSNGGPNDITLDNLRFDCIGGGAGCGILVDANGSSSFETGNTPLSDIFTFSGTVKTPWNIVNSPVSDGSFALKTPGIPKNSTAELILNKNLSQSKKIRFDARSYIGYYANVKFFINNVEYKHYSSSDQSTSNYSTFTSSSLPPGNYQFKWVVRNADADTNYINYTLDNLQFID